MHLLHEHAPGWQFHLSHYVDSSHVWQAPNGTAYVVGYFSGPNGERTPDFPQAIMDNRNNAIAYDKVSARDLTDSHRRCLCTAAAAQFGLAWQLWAREEVENPHREETKAAAPAAKIDGVSDGDQPLSKDEREQCLGLIKELKEDNLASFLAGVCVGDVFERMKPEPKIRERTTIAVGTKAGGTPTRLAHEAGDGWHRTRQLVLVALRFVPRGIEPS